MLKKTKAIALAKKKSLPNKHINRIEKTNDPYITITNKYF